MRESRIIDHSFDEVALLAEVASGSQFALRRLYSLYGSLVYSVANRFLGDEQEAEEVTQDVFVKVWRLAESFDESRCSPKGWISMIARSASLDYLRKRNRRPDRMFKNLVEMGFGEALQSQGEKMKDAEDRESRLFEGLAGLREEYRRSVELAYFKGYTQKEIGKVMKVPEGTAKTYVRRGLMKLRELFEVK